MNQPNDRLRLVGKVLGVIVCLSDWNDVVQRFSEMRLFTALGFTFFMAVLVFGLGARRRP
jgi:hypothetical protein